MCTNIQWVDEKCRQTKRKFTFHRKGINGCLGIRNVWGKWNSYLLGLVLV